MTAGLSDRSNDGLPEDATKEAIRASLMNLHTTQPGRVVSFDPVTQTATIQLTLQRNLNGTVQSVPPLQQVPVRFPRGGGFAITWPLQAGDTGTVHFCERSIDNWFLDGGEADPKDTRHHDLSDAIFKPDLHEAGSALESFNTQQLELRNQDATTRITIAQEGEVVVENPEGSIKLEQTGQVLLQNTIGTFRLTPAGKFALEGASEELLQVINDLIVVLEGAVTVLGGPFTPATIANLVAVRARLATLKV